MRIVTTIFRSNHTYLRSPTPRRYPFAQLLSSFSTYLSPNPSINHNGKAATTSNEKVTREVNKKFLSYYNSKGPLMQATQRFYPQYTVFHSSCALTFKSILPEFKRSGPSGNIAVHRKGRFLLEFSPRHSTNKREDNAYYASTTYDGPSSTHVTEWNQSLSIALNTEEIGQLICDLKNGKECNIYHNSNPDTVSKTFQAKPSVVEEGSYKFILTVGEGSSAEGDEIELNFGEMEVIKILLDNSIPYLVGWMTLMQRSLNTNLSHRIYE